MKRMKQLDQIQVSDMKKEEIFRKVIKPKHSNNVRYGFAFAMILVLVVTSLSFFSQSPSSIVVSSIAMEVNPSIVLNLDKNNRVVEVVDVNGDATDLLSEIHVIGLDIQEAMDMIIDSPVYQANYINNYLEVSVYSENLAISNSLDQLVNGVLQKNFNGKNCHSQQVDKETWENARKRNMGVGKYQAITNIIETTDEYTFDELEHCSMNELNEIQGHCQKGNGNGYRKGCND
ncbi:anti-sigma-I factor RsgI family protein [Anaerorhabdus sp.]|uniref:anti-sigma-I factor RsgI family protein n=1 Tax=Anaerorhabdus sp. TaxID=1872524 RepID=UPI002FC91080